MTEQELSPRDLRELTDQACIAWELKAEAKLIAAECGCLGQRRERAPDRAGMPLGQWLPKTQQEVN